MERTLYQENTYQVSQTKPELDLRFIFGTVREVGMANPENWVSAPKDKQLIS